MTVFKRLATGTVVWAIVGVAAMFSGPAAHATPVWYENGLKALTNKHVYVTVYGQLDFQSEEQGAVECNNVMGMSVINESEKGSVIPRGQFEGWGSNACRAPQLEEAFASLGLPTTIYASPEQPIERNLVEGEVCDSAATAEGKSLLRECPNAEEREQRPLLSPLKLRRSVTSFPWKTELIERTEADGERVTADTIGIGAQGKSCYPLQSVVIEGERTEIAGNWNTVPEGCVKIDVIAPQIPDEIEFYGSVAPVLRNGAGSAVDPSRLEFAPGSGLLVCADCEVRDPETPVRGKLKLVGAEGQQLILAR